MNKSTKLLTLIEKNNGIVTTKEAQDNGISRQYLAMFVSQGKLQRVAYGIYVSPDAFEDTMYMIQARSNKIIFSHETALYTHELTDRDPLQYSVSVPRGYGVGRLQDSGVAVYTVQNKLHQIGVETAQTIHGRDISVYNQERTVCDMIKYRNQVDGDMLTTMLKRYTNDKAKNLPRLMEYAKMFKVEKTVRQYMGVLL